MAIQQISSLATAMSTGTVATPRPAAPKEEQAAEALLPSVRQTSPTPEQVKQALGEVEKAIVSVARNLQFSIDKETGKTIITVVDAVTKEVIRQIPGEEIVAIAKAIDRMQGLLLKQKA